MQGIVRRMLLSLAVVAVLLTAPAHAFNAGRHPRASREKTTSPYVVVLDAGSSGTKVLMFRVEENPTGPQDVTQMFPTVKVRPGLHNFAGDEAGLAKYAADIFSKLNAQLNDAATPISFQSPIPVYLLATAGVRSLRAEDADFVIQTVWKKLSEHFQLPDYTFPADHCRVLTGQEEGMYAFLAANFLNGFLNDPTAPVVGILEMGGMSLQVVFPPKDLSQKTCELTAGGHVLSLYAHSYNTFGSHSLANKVMERVCAASKYGPAGSVYNPCMLRDHCESYECGGEGSAGTSVCGEGNPADCTNTLKAIVDESTASVAVDAGSTEFFTISNFREAPEDLGAIDETSKELSVSKLGSKAQTYCQKSVNELTGVKHVSDPCREGLFIHTLLGKLELNENTILIQDEMDGKKPNWAIGVAVDAVLPGVSFRC